MHTFDQLVFDDTIKGTSDAWYSPASLNELLGSADRLGVMVSVYNTAGTDIVVQPQHSGDGGKNWNDVGTAVSGALSDNAVYYDEFGFTSHLLGLVRVKVTLTGTDPQCRAKVAVTGRVT